MSESFERDLSVPDLKRTPDKKEKVICTQCDGKGSFESKFERNKNIRCDKCSGSGNVELTPEEAKRLGELRASDSSANPAAHLVALLKRSQKALVKLAGENPSEETVSLVADIAKSLAIDSLIKKGALEAVKARLGHAQGVIGLTGLPDAPPVEELEASLSPVLGALRQVLSANTASGFEQAAKVTAQEVHKLWTSIKEGETGW